MENNFIPQAIEIVTAAINEDNKKNYVEAFRLYKKALEHFMIGVKCNIFVSVYKCTRDTPWQMRRTQLPRT